MPSRSPRRRQQRCARTGLTFCIIMISFRYCPQRRWPMRERKAFSLPGGAMLLAIAAMMALTIFLLVHVTKGQPGPLPVFCFLAMVLEAICVRGLVVVNPNEGQVIQLFGRYAGTVREQGFQ